ncbi:hypothetical protein BaRGS_00021796 [Batillaria attramentaria]|uniref:Secreted protein n=1 Tax=Batillaria attramentaria TaxID=370345 RepID=A0ABD0KIW5_9CAEN
MIDTTKILYLLVSPLLTGRQPFGRRLGSTDTGAQSAAVPPRAGRSVNTARPGITVPDSWNLALTVRPNRAAELICQR